jgi:very-short-patch-repair endonuclease
MRRYLPYNKNLKQFSRDLRNHSTLGEVLLWQNLRARSMMGYQFYRQKPIENFIVDFYCAGIKLIIEVDGKYHESEEVIITDKEREDQLKKWGLNFLRFKEMDVRLKINEALLAVENYILDFESNHPECLHHNPLFQMA